VSASSQARKVFVSLFLVSSLLLTNLQSQLAFGANTTPKVDKTCVKVKATAKLGKLTLICTKLDSKLSWQPSVAQIQANSWKDLKSISSLLPNVTTALDIHLSTTVSVVSANQILESFNQAAKLWQTQYLPVKPLPTIFFTEKDRDWVVEKFENLGLYSENFIANFDDEVNRNGSRSNWAGITGENGKLWMSYMVGTQKESDSNDFQVAAHEYTHLAQFSIASNQMSELSCWQVEGGAYFYGLYLGATSEKQLKEFIKERNTQPFFLGFSGLNKQPSNNWAKLIDSFGPDFDSTKCGPDGAYPVGSVLHEYLYTLKGHAGIVQMLKDVSTEKDFYKGIEKTYGKKWITLKGDLVKYLKTTVSQSS
jgi:hypothetical protein